MRYHSTRNNQTFFNPSDAVLKGLAPDGGLFVPESLPQLSFETWQDYSYQEIAQKIFEIFFSDLDKNTIAQIVANSYGENFDDAKVVPIYWLNDETGFLELWHGPTLAFKDIALQFLPHLMQAAKKKKNNLSKILILTATSGDTGKAAMEGFSGVEGFRVVVFYPEDGVSSFQKRQMLTRQADNVRALALEGDFDDCQRGVKELFADKDFTKKMAGLGYELSSANSINIGRLVPQMIYYISAYMDAVKSGRLAYGEALNVVVPTGNFGNILAACYAQEMGLPLGDIQLAANPNNVLADFLQTGIYDANRDLVKTSSPSMDILVASNLERYLYLKNPDSEWLAGLMEDLKERGLFKVSQEFLDIKASSVGEKETSQAIAEVYDKFTYLIDPHTAVAYAISQDLSQGKKTLVASTASPYKFMAKVLESLNQDMPEDDYEAIRKIAKLINPDEYSIPPSVDLLWQTDQDSEIVIRPNLMVDTILDLTCD